MAQPTPKADQTRALRERAYAERASRSQAPKKAKVAPKAAKAAKNAPVTKNLRLKG